MFKFSAARRRIAGAGFAIALAAGLTAASAVGTTAAANADVVPQVVAQAAAQPVSLTCAAASVSLSGYTVIPETPAVYAYRYSILYASGAQQPGSSKNPYGLAGTWTGSSKNWTFTTQDAQNSKPAPVNEGGWGEWTSVGDGELVSDGVTGNDLPNTVEIALDGLPTVNMAFGGSYEWSTTFDDGQDHRLEVKVVAWNGSGNITFDETTTDCAIVIPVPSAPAPIAPTCDAPGQVYVPESTAEITWSRDGNSNNVKAKANKGYVFADGKNVQTFAQDVEPQLTGEQCDPESIEPEVIAPTSPEAEVIEACGTYGSITQPETDERIAYTIEGGDWSVRQGSFAITAMPAEGYRFDAETLLDGWVLNENGTATFAVELGSFTPCVEEPENPGQPQGPGQAENPGQPDTSRVVDLPDSLPASDGELENVPANTDAGQTLMNVIGRGFAPGAPVTFGIYSTPTVLAKVTADATGVATAVVTIPAGFSGNHTVVAAGVRAGDGTPQFLQAGTVVKSKDVGGVSAGPATTPPVSSPSKDVGGVTVGPNSGPRTGLADTGAPIDPIALGQVALMVMLAGAGMLVIARRRQPRRH